MSFLTGKYKEGQAPPAGSRGDAGPCQDCQRLTPAKDGFSAGYSDW